MKKAQGFTLAELLIALALLGVIAAFTIPKLLNATKNQEAQAKIKETVATLEQGWYNARLQNSYVPGTTLYNLYNRSLNYANASNLANNATNAPFNGLAAHPCAGMTGWIQFQNAVVVSGLETPGTALRALGSEVAGGMPTNYNICIDYNGKSMPNTVGSDVFVGVFNQAGAFNSTAVTADQMPEAVRTFNWGNAPSVSDTVNNATPTTTLQFTGGTITGSALDCTQAVNACASKILGIN
jgi:prepilin-type N-terminal cleavage/methylation domain-containing protein